MGIRKNKAYTISFFMIDSANRPSRLSGLSFGAGDTKISKDGASFANTTNNAAEIGSTGRYSLALTAAEMNADHVHIYASKSGSDDQDVAYATGGQPSGSVVTNGGNTSSTFQTDLTDTATDYWKDALILFTSGSLSGQVKKIGAYNGTTKFITTVASSAFTTAPSGGDRFVLVDL